MGELFPNQCYGARTWIHCNLPIIKSHDFNFYRCVQFTDDFYGKTISSLHSGNLRVSRKDNRYSQLFPGQKLSYWADSPRTARAEVKKWGANNNLLTFGAYDDGSSFIPTVYPADQLRIVDGINLGFDRILKKMDENIPFSDEEEYYIEKIALEEPDCLAYKSEAKKDGICFLFFEHGFKKLSLREVSLRLGSEKGRNHAIIPCASTSDFTHILESYGCYFMPKAQVKTDEKYKNTDEYILRKQVEYRSWEKIYRSEK